MSQEYVDSVLRELHLAELQRKDTLNGQLSVPIAVVTVLCGVVAFYVQTCPDVQFDSRNWDGFLTWFVFSLTGLFLGVGVAVYFLIAAHFNYRYGSLSRVEELRVFIDGTKDHYEYINDGDHESTWRDVANDLRRLLRTQYVACAQMNWQANMVKANRIHYANIAMIVSLVILGQSLIPFHVTSCRYESAQKVEIVKVP